MANASGIDNANQRQASSNESPGKESARESRSCPAEQELGYFPFLEKQESFGKEEKQESFAGKPGDLIARLGDQYN